MSADVDLEELAALTKNFSGAELEGLVRAAISKAIFGLVKVRVPYLDCVSGTYLLNEVILFTGHWQN